MGIFSRLFRKKTQPEKPNMQVGPVVPEVKPEKISEEIVVEDSKESEEIVTEPKKADVKRLEGVTRRNGIMEIFEMENGKKIVAVDLKETKDAARTIANSYFRAKKDSLKCSYGYMKKDDLYFEEVPGATKVWLFRRKQKGEK